MCLPVDGEVPGTAGPSLDSDLRRGPGWLSSGLDRRIVNMPETKTWKGACDEHKIDRFPEPPTPRSCAWPR